jgi:hypothetical protein
MNSSKNREIIGIAVFLILSVAFFITLLSFLPSYEEIRDMPDRPLTIEQWSYYGNQYE